MDAVKGVMVCRAVKREEVEEEDEIFFKKGGNQKWIVTCLH